MSPLHIHADDAAPGRALSPAQAAAELDPIRAGLLSNGTYRTLVRERGGGYSAFGDLALTRWRADALERLDGFQLYLRDLADGRWWSATTSLDGDRVLDRRFEGSPGRVRQGGTADGVEFQLDTCVLTQDPGELRHLVLRNHSARTRLIEVTSFCEIALLQLEADLAHPGFSRLFVQTEFESATGLLMARRRARRSGEIWPVLAHTLLGAGSLQVESDRGRFIGRGRDLSRPLAMQGSASLSGTTGSVLDPALCLRRVIEMAPGGEGTLLALLAASAETEDVRQMAIRLADDGERDRAFERAGEAARERFAECGLTPDQAARLEALAVALQCGPRGPRPTPRAADLARNAHQRRQRLGLDSARPMVLIDERSADSSPDRESLARAFRYWRSLGCEINAAVITGEPSASGESAPAGDDGLRVFSAASLDREDLDVVLAAARVVTREDWRADGSSAATTPLPADDAGRTEPLRSRPALPAEGARKPVPEISGPALPAPAEALRFFNGYGGFSEPGDEYVIHVDCDAGGVVGLPPRPWVNVIANPRCGFLLSETGAGFTWSANSRERRLSPWANDPLLDPNQEALYLRDDESREFWSPLPGPSPAEGRYEVRHGFGYSVCRYTRGAIEQEVRAFVPVSDPVKLVQVRLVNHGSSARRLSLFGFQRLVLGELPIRSARFVETWLEDGAVLARNPMSGEFAARVAFASLAVEGVPATLLYSGDRAEFLGPGGSLRSPRALSQVNLMSRVGSGLDPCFAEQATFELAAGAAAEVLLLFGEGDHPDEARELLARYRESGAATQALADSRRSWQRLLGTIQVETPVPALDLMVNGWLLYQTVSCRMWGRSALYQSGGAFGFRDQLQDAAALVAVRPDWTRAQILLHAAHQFVEGDVLHWWHPPADRGLRTRFADDLLWLPYVTSHYVRATGDREILAEMVPYLKAGLLAEGQDEALVPAEPAHEFRELYEHCCRAIDRSMATGDHGLPLFGTGDWNDGMNAVGRLGRGESVWMGFFLYAVLGDFLPLCRAQGDQLRAVRYQEHRERLRTALELEAWDGEWYRRGWYDDGAPLGSKDSDECQIDALVQAWAVISGAAARPRTETAMNEVEARLVLEREQLVRLLDPPFDRTVHDPGYIRGYLPGVRENGGQYTHAALWVVRALFEIDRPHRAAKLLEMLSPVSHTASRAAADLYEVEPYVVAADVYGAPPHVGRGGWTWYTGSAGWMFRVVIESLFGMRFDAGNRLLVSPRVPIGWKALRVRYRPPGRGGVLEIDMKSTALRTAVVLSAELDGVALPVEAGEVTINLPEGAGTHQVNILLGDPN